MRGIGLLWQGVEHEMLLCAWEQARSIARIITIEPRG